MIKLCPPSIDEHEPVLFAKIGSRTIMLMEDVEIFGVVLPQGYISDGCSVPSRYTYFILDPFGDGLLSALVHDFRYTNHIDKVFTRKEADWEFFNNLEKCGVNIIRRGLALLALRWFGWIYWNRNRKYKLEDGYIKHIKVNKTKLEPSHLEEIKDKTLKP